MNSHHRSIGLVFAVHGMVAGSMSTRIPWIQDQLDLGPGTLGLALLCPSIGAFLAMPTASRLAHRFGTRATSRLLIALWCAGVLLPALSPAPGWLFAAFLLYGAAAGMSDVVMNAHGVVVEKHLGRPIISGLHGMWAVGSLAGGGLGVLAAQFGLDARLHLAAVSVVMLGVGVLAGRGLLADGPAGAHVPAPRRFALPTRAIAAIGVVGFCGTFAEGASANWAAVYVTEVASAGPGMAAATYTIFMLFMASTRLAGDRIVQRFGPVTVVRLSGATAAIGALLVVVARTPALAIAGFSLLGLGVAVVVPLVFAAAGRTGATPGEGVAGVATITYLSGLTAPAITGWAAGAFSYPAAFTLVAVILVAMSALAGALRPKPAPAQTPEPALR
ncbi:MFS transporter [Nonomuraea soli]|uniref:MFS family permease n=1 Tax=Nonomuraea soli TaxID=1032476 RepID=A0A7W0HT76_9ACTN|nr:MFS transporter [Nonomuraea soli]MBA2894682.1 MFS family permease [Nonomuraea soli]